MNATDKPALRFRVEQNGLVPADAYSAEQFSLLPLHSEASWRISGDSLPPNRKAFWAILARVVALPASPWKNTREASAALRWTMGVTDSFKTMSGQVQRYPASLQLLSDDAFDAFYEGALALLRRITGLDVEQLGRLADGTYERRERKPRQTATEPAATEPAIATETAHQETDVSVGSEAGQSSKPAGLAAATEPANSTAEDERECVRKLIQLARDADLSESDRQAEIKAARKTWADKLPGRASFLDTVESTALRVAAGQLRHDSASAYLISMVGKK